MKNIIKIITVLLMVFAISCSKDDDSTKQNINEPIPTNYAAFGYFKGTINYPNEIPIPVIFLLEENNKLVVVQTLNTVNESNNIQKGNYTINGNVISGSYTNQNIIPPTTYNFSGNFDPKTAKISGTIGTGTIVLTKLI